MDDKRRRNVLVTLLVASTAVGVYVYWPGSGGTGQARAGSNPRRSTTAAAGQATALEVHTEALQTERPHPGTAERNLFRFKPKYVPPPPSAPRGVVPEPMPSGPPPPPPVPAIGLKFIGLLEPGPGQRIAVLSDGRGAPIYGKEGESLLGQYRILRIGPESIELEYIDGRGRQAIRLSGS